LTLCRGRHFFFSRWLVLGLEAIRAHLDAFAINSTPLKIGIFPGPVHGIIVRAKQAASADHLRTFFTNGAFSHDGKKYIAKLSFWQGLRFSCFSEDEWPRRIANAEHGRFNAPHWQSFLAEGDNLPKKKLSTVEIFYTTINSSSP